MIVWVIIVNYEADEHVVNCIRSIKESLELSTEWSADISVFDNSQKSTEQLQKFRKQLQSIYDRSCVVSCDKNMGYFGCIPDAQNRIKAGYDYVIYCNPDLLVDDQFFLTLGSMDNDEVGIIAPSIISLNRSFDQNPKYMKRLSERKLRCLNAIYSSRLLFSAYGVLGWLKELLNKRPLVQGKECFIYAPHGSFFIFKGIRFFQSLPPYPCFLFGEELFVGEEARMRDLKIMYNPKLIVNDIRHASISEIGMERRRTYMRKSVEYILAKYY